MAGETKFTVDNIATRCLKIRVDFLDGEELDQELASRKIFLTGDQSMSRRRRALRKALKQERDQEVMGKDLHNSPVDDLQICEAKLCKLETVSFLATHIAPKCQSMLLHLANRLLVLIEHSGEEIQIIVQELLHRVLGHPHHYYGEDERVSSSDEDPLVDEEEEGPGVLDHEEDWENEVENKVRKTKRVTQSQPDEPLIKITETQLDDEDMPTVEDVFAKWGRAEGSVFGIPDYVQRRSIVEDQLINLLCLLLAMHIITHNTRQRSLTRLLFSWLVLLVFGLLSIFSAVGFGIWVVLLQDSARSRALSGIIMHLWFVLHTQSSSLILLGMTMRKRLMNSPYGPILMYLMQALNWTVQRRMPIASWVLERILSLICIAMMQNIVQSVPPLVMIFCITTGTRTSLAVASLLILIAFARALMRYSAGTGASGSGYRSLTTSSTRIVLGFLLCGAIWASEHVNYPIFAFCLSISLVIGILLLDHIREELILEYVSSGVFPEGVATNEDSEEDITGPLVGTLGDERVEVIGVTESISIPEYLVLLCFGA